VEKKGSREKECCEKGEGHKNSGIWGLPKLKKRVGGEAKKVK